MASAAWCASPSSMRRSSVVYGRPCSVRMEPRVPSSSPAATRGTMAIARMGWSRTKGRNRAGVVSATVAGGRSFSMMDRWSAAAEPARPSPSRTGSCPSTASIAAATTGSTWHTACGTSSSPASSRSVTTQPSPSASTTRSAMSRSSAGTSLAAATRAAQNSSLPTGRDGDVPLTLRSGLSASGEARADRPGGMGRSPGRTRRRRRGGVAAGHRGRAHAQKRPRARCRYSSLLARNVARRRSRPSASTPAQWA